MPRQKLISQEFYVQDIDLYNKLDNKVLWIPHWIIF